MNLESIRAQLDWERRTLATKGVAIEIRPLVTRVGGKDGSWHSVIFSALSEENADAVIAEEVKHFHAIGVEMEWKVYAHDQPKDLCDRLRRQGFEIGPCETVMALDLRDQAKWISDPLSCEIIRATTSEHVEMYQRVAERVFEKNYEFTANQLLNGIHAGSTNHVAYIAMFDGVPASIGRLYTHPDSAFGGLYGGGTLKEFRGRGLYRAVVAARARDAQKLGSRYLIVDALPTSRPVLEKMGFVRLTQTWPCVLGKV
jgi:hypothetical protein